MKALREFIIRLFLREKPKGVMTALPNKDLVDMNMAIVAEKLMRNGIDPRSLKNANQVENAIKMIDDRPAVPRGIRSTPEAKVFDMEGKEIPKGAKIMGGKEVKETDAQIKARLDKGNKEGIARIRARQKMVEDAIDNQSPGLTGDRKYDAEIVAEDLAERMGLVYDDMPTKERLKLYDEAYTALSKKRAEMRKAERFDLDKIAEDIDPEDFAQGGIARLGFKDGMTRRTFLKILGGAMSIPIIGKFLKPMKVGKTVTKVPMIKTDNVPGKPEWFDTLVNKVIMEGDDVTKKFATAERQSIHQKKLDDGSVVRVTEDIDDGAIRVEYQSEKNVFGDDVQLQYKKPLPDEGDPRPTAEFTTAESGPVGRQVGPDDYDIDVDEVGGSSIVDLDSDVSKLKEYATGKKPTMKEIVQNKRRRDKAKAITEGGDEMIDAVTRRQGDYVPEPDDFASGGIARMLGE